MATMSDKTNEIEHLCLQLFDRWCKQRSVIPLAYLMHAWPVCVSDTWARVRLLSTLRELRQFHSCSLQPDDHQAIERFVMIHECIENQNLDPLP